MSERVETRYAVAYEGVSGALKVLDWAVSESDAIRAAIRYNRTDLASLKPYLAVKQNVTYSALEKIA